MDHVLTEVTQLKKQFHSAVRGDSGKSTRKTRAAKLGEVIDKKAVEKLLVDAIKDIKRRKD